jgi:hypothetical protein
MARRRPATRHRSSQASSGRSPFPQGELAGVLDDVKATTLALLASLRDKERRLRAQAVSEPGPGVVRGLSDIAALRHWADRTLRTIEVLERGRAGELKSLLEELGEFGAILRRRQPPPSPPAGA